jgi:hypothetical protein
MVTGIVAANDGVNLPPLKFVQERVAINPYFAHKQLIKFVGGN